MPTEAERAKNMIDEEKRYIETQTEDSKKERKKEKVRIGGVE